MEKFSLLIMLLVLTDIIQGNADDEQGLCLECKDYLSETDCVGNRYMGSYCTWDQNEGCIPLNTTAHPINEYYQF